jgi:hypothetical protein
MTEPTQEQKERLFYEKSRREMAALFAMQGLLAYIGPSVDAIDIARGAIRYSDALLDLLDGDGT